MTRYSQPLVRIFIRVSLVALLILMIIIPEIAAAQNKPAPPAILKPGENPICLEDNTQKAPERNRNIEVSDTSESRPVPSSTLLRTFTYRSLRFRLYCDPLISGVTYKGQATLSIYELSKNLVNFGVLMILLVIAFANILRIKLDTYKVKKSIPLLIFGVVAANLSLPIIRSIVDFSGVLTATLIGETSAAGTAEGFIESVISAVYYGGTSTIAHVFNGANSGSFPWASLIGIFGFVGFMVLAPGPFFFAIVIIALFLLILPALMFFYLGILFVARIYVLVILTAVSPIAFASLGFEPLKGKLWGWWWNKFLTWTFMAPATVFFLWLGVQFYYAVDKEPDIGTYILMLFLVGFATQIPTKWGGSIMSKWAGAVADPIKNFAFSQARSAVQAVPARAGANLRTGAGWAARSLRTRMGGLNFSQLTEAIGQGIEERVARGEATSTSTRMARDLKKFASDATISRENFRRVVARDFQTGTRDWQVANEYSDRLLNQHGVVSGEFTEMLQHNRTAADAFVAANQAAMRSGNLDQMIGAYYANAKAGRVLSNQELQEFTDNLRRQGLTDADIDSINYQFYNQYKAHHPSGAATTSTRNPDGSATRNSEERKFAFAHQANNQVSAIARDDHRQAAYKKMVEQLAVPGTNSLRDISEIEGNDTLFGYAKVLLQKQQAGDAALPGDPQSRAIISQLQAQEERLGQAQTDTVVRPTVSSTIVRAMRPTNRGIDASHFAPLFQPGQINDLGWHGLARDQRRAVRDLLLHHPGRVKTEVERYGNDTVGRIMAEVQDASDNPLPAGVAAPLHAAIAGAVDTAHPAAPPTPIDRAAILAIVGDERATDQIIALLRTFNGTLENIRNFTDMHSRGTATI